MTTQILEELVKPASQLSSTEQLPLAARLIEQARYGMPPAASVRSRRKWCDIRGLAKPSMFGQDAQAYISCSRQEDEILIKEKTGEKGTNYKV